MARGSLNVGSRPRGERESSSSAPAAILSQYGTNTSPLSSCSLPTSFARPYGVSQSDDLHLLFCFLARDRDGSRLSCRVYQRFRNEEGVLCGIRLSIAGHEWPDSFRSVRRLSSAGVHRAQVPPEPLEGAAVALHRSRLPWILLGGPCGPGGFVELPPERRDQPSGVLGDDTAARESTTSGRNVKRYACCGPWG